VDALHVDHLLDDMILDEDAITTTNFSGNLADFASHPCAVGFGQSNLTHGSLTLLVEEGNAVAHGDHGLDISYSTLELLLDDLERVDCLPELLPLRCVLQGSLNSSSGAPSS